MNHESRIMNQRTLDVPFSVDRVERTLVLQNRALHAPEEGRLFRLAERYELRYGLTVLGNHVLLPALPDAVHQLEAPGLELAGREALAARVSSEERRVGEECRC